MNLKEFKTELETEMEKQGFLDDIYCITETMTPIESELPEWEKQTTIQFSFPINPQLAAWMDKWFPFGVTTLSPTIVRVNTHQNNGTKAAAFPLLVPQEQTVSAPASFETVMNHSFDICIHCGAEKGLHQSETNHCPLHGKELSMDAWNRGERQKWQPTVFESRDIFAKVMQSAADGKLINQMADALSDVIRHPLKVYECEKAYHLRKSIHDAGMDSVGMDQDVVNRADYYSNIVELIKKAKP
jgi:hypothetical protein